jgi:hypothetical protein
MNDQEYGQQLEAKLELYFLGLIFTILALAVQTAKFDNINIVAAFLELTSWMALLVSGLVGLWRMEWLPIAHFAHYDQCQSESDLQQFNNLAQEGIESIPLTGQDASAPIEDFIENRKQHILRMKENKHKYEKANYRKYRLQKWSFVFGIILLIGARGTGPATKVFKSIEGSAPTPVCLSIR